jgi:hypothetical protein
LEFCNDLSHNLSFAGFGHHIQLSILTLTSTYLDTKVKGKTVDFLGLSYMYKGKTTLKRLEWQSENIAGNAIVVVSKLSYILSLCESSHYYVKTEKK